jgi:hypothetical protein
MSVTLLSAFPGFGNYRAWINTIFAEARLPDGRKERTKEEKATANWASLQLNPKDDKPGPWFPRMERLLMHLNSTRPGKFYQWGRPAIPDYLGGADPRMDVAIGDVIGITPLFPEALQPFVGHRAVVESVTLDPITQIPTVSIQILDATGQATGTSFQFVRAGQDPDVLCYDDFFFVVGKLQPRITWVQPRTRMDDWQDVAAAVRRAAEGTPEMEHLSACLERLKPQ